MSLEPVMNKQRRELDDVLKGTRYKPIRVLGSGGMGKVLLAEHRALRTKVCVKVLHDDLADNESVLDRFRIEAQALANLGGGNHPHLVHVHDYGITDHGQPFLAMEYLGGESLLDVRKERGEIPWLEACAWVVQALKGVAVAHKAGIIHRDIKTANLFLCRDADDRPLVKVLDFGVAKLLLEAPVSPAAFPTASGLMIGTPRYASPEQVCGEAVDARTDVYSMALVLFELITGQPPYPELKSVNEILKAQAVDPLPLASTVAKQQVPRVLDAMIAKAAEKNRADRYPDAAAFAAALERLLTPTVPAKRSPRPQPARMTQVASSAEQAQFAEASSDEAASPTEPAQPLFLPSSEEDAATLALPIVAGPGSITRAESRARSRTFFVIAIVSTLCFLALGSWALFRWLP